MAQTLTAQEAAELLGVTRQTLYAYVSRGLLTTETGDTPRERRYPAHEVMALKASRQQGRAPRAVAQATLDWGLPVMPSAITLIDQGRLYYRGQNAATLAREASLEETAALLWQLPQSALRRDSPWPDEGLARQDSPEWLLNRFVHVSERLEEDVGPGSDARQAERSGAALRAMAFGVCGRQDAGLPIHHLCARAWQLDEWQADRLRMALVLCADHELNPSSFAARCTAATGASTRAALIAALATLSGPRHGGATARVAALFNEISASDAAEVLRARLARGDAIEGFGHPLYPQGDPRAAQILAGLPHDPIAEAIVKAMSSLTGLSPSLDFALVALSRALALPRGAAFGLFALGRCVGWIAHILEQRASGGPIRPRAHYVGEPPRAWP